MEDYQGALECFNKAYQTYKSGNFRTDLSSGNIEYINKTLSENRNAIILKNLENQMAELDARLGKLMQNSSISKCGRTALEQFFMGFS